MTAANTVVITGIGVVSPLGNSSPELWRRLMAGESAAREWPDFASAGYRACVACRVDDLDAPPLRRGRALAVAAARQAVASARLQLPPDTGVFVGSTLGESYAFEQAAEGVPLDVLDFTVESFVDAIRRELGAGGAARSVATACAAGNYAVGAAAAAIKRGRVRAAIAGGVEPFSRLAMVGFSRSRAMAAGACRPFDRRRTGMLLGEGAALFVLERADDAVRRGVTPLAEVAALGLSCDAHHAVIPRPDGSGMLEAMRSALARAGIAARDLDWINVHGSATRPSDAAEGRAIRALLEGADAPPVSGSKGALGHALGAASALELAICLEGMRANTVPPTAGHEEADEECGVACTSRPVPRSLRWVMNNAFAFGGLNSSLLLRAWESQRDQGDRGVVPIKLDAYLESELEHDTDRATLEALADRVQGLFESRRASTRAGLYVASSNAGCRSALLFWQEVQRAGVAFANPELFPWTLANAPCGFLARRFQITGPNATYTGGSEAVMGAMEQAAEDLDAGAIDAAWILAIDFAVEADRRTRFVLARASSAALAPGRIDLDGRAIAGARSACEALAELVRAA